MIRYTEEEWLKKGKELFGEKRKDWQYVCPHCGTVQSATLFLENGISETQTMQGVVGFSCIGRFTDKKIGCDWTCGGFLQIHESEVITKDNEIVPVFSFKE